MYYIALLYTVKIGANEYPDFPVGQTNQGHNYMESESKLGRPERDARHRTQQDNTPEFGTSSKTSESTTNDGTRLIEGSDIRLDITARILPYVGSASTIDVQGGFLPFFRIVAGVKLPYYIKGRFIIQ